MDQYTQMMSVPQLIHRFVHDLEGVERLVLAVSGGLDSMALLHGTVEAQLSQPLLVIYVNHQLSPHAASWQAHVCRSCAELGVEFAAVAVQVRSDGTGVEEAARQARYQAIERHLRPGDLVLMAHHRQDQMETFFLRLARGAGARGLAGMAPLREWGPARLGRPLLSVDRKTLEAYAQRKGFKWVEDESNASERFDRNFLRLKVVPELQQRWPQLPRQMAQTMGLLRETDELLNEFAAEDLQACKPRQERLGVSLEMAPLLRWSPQRGYNLMRHWLALQGYRSPSHKRLEQLYSLLQAQQDQSPLLHWGDCELRRYRDRLYCLPAGWQQPLLTPQAGIAPEALDLGDSRLAWKPASPGLPPGPYRVVARAQAGEIKRAHPLGRTHSQTLKKLLQEYELEPWLRERVPFILQGDRLVAVGDLWIEKGAATESGMAPIWSFPSLT